MDNYIYEIRINVIDTKERLIDINENCVYSYLCICIVHNI